MRFTFVVLMLLISANAAVAAPNFDFALTGDHGICGMPIILLPTPPRALELIGTGAPFLEVPTTLDYVAAAPEGRVIGSISSNRFAFGGVTLVEVQAATRATLFSGLPGQRLRSMSVDRSGTIYAIVSTSTTHSLATITQSGVLTSLQALPILLSPFPLSIPSDLAADQCTLFYARGDTIGRINACNGTVLTDFAGIGTNIRDIDILPDGGALVSTISEVERFNSGGTLVQIYAPPGLVGLALGPNGSSFHTVEFRCGGQVSQVLAAFSVATGERLGERALSEIREPTSIAATRGWTAAIGALAGANASDIPTLSTSLAIALGALLAIAAIIRLRY